MVFLTTLKATYMETVTDGVFLRDSDLAWEVHLNHVLKSQDQKKVKICSSVISLWIWVYSKIILQTYKSKINKWILKDMICILDSAAITVRIQLRFIAMIRGDIWYTYRYLSSNWLFEIIFDLAISFSFG